MNKPGKAEQTAARGERLSAALRENLKRRKAQARSRAAAGRRGGESIKDAGQIASKIPDFRRNEGNQEC